jgi:hypothetical protein
VSSWLLASFCEGFSTSLLDEQEKETETNKPPRTSKIMRFLSICLSKLKNTHKYMPDAGLCQEQV